MVCRVAIQMDPIATIDITADSTFVLGLEAQRRGYDLYHYLPETLSFRDRRATANLCPMQLRPVPGDHATLEPGARTDLATMDVVLMRQDPPFDMSYITATHILEAIHPETLVVNDPREVRNAPEKIMVCDFPDLMPATLISRDQGDIREFRREFGDIIVKPLYGNGGIGVFHIRPEDENLNALLELFLAQSREPLMIQRYLPAVREGDKRIILVDGEAVGALNRVPAAGEARSNMHVGGVPGRAELSPRDREICAALGPELKRRGLIFVGIDVIGDYLTEINVTSPTGLQEINRFDGVNLEARIWDAIETRL